MMKDVVWEGFSLAPSLALNHTDGLHCVIQLTFKKIEA